MASEFALRERALNQKLFSELVQAAAGLEPGTENFAIALQFCLRNTAEHSYLDPNPSNVSKQFAELLKRLEVNAQLKKAHALEVLTGKFKEQPITSFYPDIHAAILSLLYSLAEAPATTPLDFEPQLFQEQQNFDKNEDSESVDSEWSYRWSTESDLKSEDDLSDAEDLTESSEEKGPISVGSEPSSFFDWKTFSLDLRNSGEEENDDPGSLEEESTLIGAILKSRGRGVAFFQPNPKLRMTEGNLVRQLLHLLQGTVQSAFRWHRQGFQLVPGVHVSHLSMSSLQNLLAPFVLAASSLKRIQAWISNVRFKTSQSFGDDRRRPRGPTMEAFASALLVQTEGLLAVVSEAETRAARGAAGTEVTLLALRQNLRGVLARSRFLERVLDAVNGAETGSAAEDAGNVVSVLYQLLGQQCLLEDGEEAAYRTLLQLFLATVQPLLDSLDSWLEEGVLQDAANELFICANSSIPIQNSAFWLLGHSLRRRTSRSSPRGLRADRSQSGTSPLQSQSEGQPAGSRYNSFTLGQPFHLTSDLLQASNASTPTSFSPEPDDLICPPFLTSLAPAILRTGKSLQLLNHFNQEQSPELTRPSAGPFPRTFFPFSSPSRSPFKLSTPTSPGLKGPSPPTPPDSRVRRASLVSQLPSPSQRASPLGTPVRSGNASSPSTLQTSTPEPVDEKMREDGVLLQSTSQQHSLYAKFCASLQALVTTKEPNGADASSWNLDLVAGGSDAPECSGNSQTGSKWAKHFLVEHWAAALQGAAADVSGRASVSVHSDASHSFSWQQPGSGASEIGSSCPQPGESMREGREFESLPPLNDRNLVEALARKDEEEPSTSGRQSDESVAHQWGYPGSDFAEGQNGGALLVEACRGDVSSLLQGAVRDPTWLPPFRSGMDVFLRAARDGGPAGDAVRWLDEAKLRETPPPSVLIQECLLTHISNQIDLVGARLLSRLMGEWQLIEELAILRAIYLMGSGDVLHHFTASLFTKLERKEPWDDFYELNTMLQNSVRASGDSALSLVQDSLVVHVVDPGGDTGEASSSFKPVLRSFGIDALDALRFSYKVSWPLELIISESAIQRYNQVMAFLLKLKRAKHGLDRAARWKLNGIDSSRDKQRLLFQQKLLHFINTLHQYVMDRVLHSAWLDLRTEMSAASSLDEVIACHERYLGNIQKQCLVASDKLWTLLASRIRTMISIALEFCALQRTFALGGVTADVLARCEAEVQRLERQFHDSMVFLLRVLSSKLNVGHFPHLADLVIRINYNHYYMNEQGRILLPAASTGFGTA